MRPYIDFTAYGLGNAPSEPQVRKSYLLGNARFFVAI